MSGWKPREIEPILIEAGEIDCWTPDPCKVVKKIIREGSGDRPSKGMNVRVHYVGTLTDGTEFDSSRERKKVFEFNIGEGKVIKGWDIGIATMQVGEISIFKIAPDYAYGVMGKEPKIPSNANLIFNIEMIAFFPTPTSIEEKMAYGIERRLQGNDFVQKELWDYAGDQYERGIEMCENIECASDLMKAEHIKLMQALFLNRALCYLKVGAFKECIDDCTRALKYNPKNAKAYFRRGSAYKGQREWDAAIADFTRAAKIAPNDKTIRDELSFVMDIRQKETAKQKATYTTLFEKMKEENEEESGEKKEERKEDEK
ncbi:putative peptidyl-prolyl cis-trans isomerase [Monocercomonoides exilis]|uniref:putative peptidyl-prolyl cis-trans isomerase n=1 Tax=Monocercomonoides exilis TaxID=2049356 RepID=UPI00355A24A0|nr:putative peptidyl-prolyl cis-trans isomerase [Monocercomonoides exilis]|eukprot:MONOS_6091.1-p1 / transcript=MONOS_6091.1 / gene=MONOS_6091 / organism=Monocercomonoides_exilis_PA203 / gene_product=peptidyl-prolyl cis-trans isomerase / transcript_product=peptidyl-prolyl cis-trans isomerase / location=Mono_scaffold00187:76601-77545(-) / protein_length=315 / sequence_SO=supercontig / SO=protein_coding / is_pseudo=false